MLTRFRILTVCIGNVCRSPLAERLLRLRLAEAGLAASYDVTSAGLRAMVGHPMEPTAAGELTRLGGDPDGFVARRLTAQMANEADLVLTATTDVRRRVVEEAPGVDAAYVHPPRVRAPRRRLLHADRPRAGRRLFAAPRRAGQGSSRRAGPHRTLRRVHARAADLAAEAVESIANAFITTQAGLIGTFGPLRSGPPEPLRFGPDTSRFHAGSWGAGRTEQGDLHEGGVHMFLRKVLGRAVAATATTGLLVAPLALATSPQLMNVACTDNQAETTTTVELEQGQAQYGTKTRVTATSTGAPVSTESFVEFKVSDGDRTVASFTKRAETDGTVSRLLPRGLVADEDLRRAGALRHVRMVGTRDLHRQQGHLRPEAGGGQQGQGEVPHHRRRRRRAGPCHRPCEVHRAQARWRGRRPQGASS